MKLIHKSADRFYRYIFLPYAGTRIFDGQNKWVNIRKWVCQVVIHYIRIHGENDTKRVSPYDTGPCFACAMLCYKNNSLISLQA